MAATAPARSAGPGDGGSVDGTWDRVLGEVLIDADADGLVDWQVSTDSSPVRAHQHGTNTSRPARALLTWALRR